MSQLRDRMGGELDPAMRRFASSAALDRRLVEEDIRGSIAHATMLGEQGILEPALAATIVRHLEGILEEWQAGTFEVTDQHEDVHMAVESRLIERMGPEGGALHTARSRNDQIATDLRLWMRSRLSDLQGRIASLIEALLLRVEEDGQVLIPGFTHLQRGQPVLFGHHLLAHAWALDRDRERLAAARTRLNYCPLGACALAGTPHPIDRDRTAELLGFAGPMENAMDAVSARDHVLETVAALSILSTHLSRMAEELVLWSSAEFGLIRLSAAYSSGSSIMPQKRNPDAAELVRGHAGRTAGAMAGLLALVKGLPLAYNRDLQEERFHLYAAADSVSDCLEILRGAYATLEVDRGRYEKELASDWSLATDLADHLVTLGVPFREAHGRVARAVARLEAEGRSLRQLAADERITLHPQLTEEALQALLDPEASVRRHRSLGGTAPEEMERQVRLLRERLASRSEG